ncbi:MAG: hypothetical protein FWG81_12020, partial [Betaproteobacteria bacterium]|nr:hypothetical protein [Betaproteobacteria bacterium]
MIAKSIHACIENAIGSRNKDVFCRAYLRFCSAQICSSVVFSGQMILPWGFFKTPKGPPAGGGGRGPQGGEMELCQSGLAHNFYNPFTGSLSSPPTV